MKEEIFDIHDEKESKEYRFVLGKTLNMKDKTVLCIGYNPSIACSITTDNTMSSLIKILSNKYSRVIMMNIIPERATKPENLSMNLSEEIIKKNYLEYKRIIKQYKICDLYCVWGGLIPKQKYYLLKNLYDELKKIKKLNYYCLYKLKYGHPKHPNRYNGNKLTHEKFDIEKYIEDNTKIG